MGKDCKLIGTLPNIHDKKSIEEMMGSEEISSVRYNSGVSSLLSEREIIERLKFLEEKYKKRIWIDLKGRQLRVISWADPKYEAIELNHEIEIEYPAKVIFRSSNESDILHTKGNKIILTLPPEKALGKGQSLNIKAKSLNIKGYLTDQDKELIKESQNVGMNHYMASFVEREDDLISIFRLNPSAEIVSKIESEKGMEFVRKSPTGFKFMAARDDLYIETSKKIEMLKYLREIVEKDKNAICASRIFSSLNHSHSVSLSDYEDLELMYLYGYRNYMLPDDVNGPKLKKTLEAWRDFINE